MHAKAGIAQCLRGVSPAWRGMSGVHYRRVECVHTIQLEDTFVTLTITSEVIRSSITETRRA